MTAPSACAVLLFVRYPEPGLVKTRLAAGIGDEAAADIYDSMARHIAGKLRAGAAAWGYRLHLYATPPERLADIVLWLNDGRPPVLDAIAQPEGSLGTRLEEAFAIGFTRLHAETVIVIGSDAPDLAPSHLAQARAALGSHDAVVGRAMDGGFYLLAMRRPAPGILASIAYSTDRTCDDLTGALRAAGFSVDDSCLPTLHDIDTEEDLAHLPIGLREGRTDA